jgi:four helix bundle protein
MAQGASCGRLRTTNCELRTGRGASYCSARRGSDQSRTLLSTQFRSVDPLISFAEWEKSARNDGPFDPLWRMTAYRLAVFAAECGWEDVRSLGRNYLTRPIAAQLYRAVGSIAANIAEGYSRSSGRDRVRFFEYGLGSAREARVWYRLARPVLGSTAYRRRVNTLSEICALLLAAIPAERHRDVRPSAE